MLTGKSDRSGRSRRRQGRKAGYRRAPEARRAAGRGVRRHPYRQASLYQAIIDYSSDGITIVMAKGVFRLKRGRTSPGGGGQARKPRMVGGERKQDMADAATGSSGGSYSSTAPVSCEPWRAARARPLSEWVRDSTFVTGRDFVPVLKSS